MSWRGFAAAADRASAFQPNDGEAPDHGRRGTAAGWPPSAGCEARRRFRPSIRITDTRPVLETTFPGEVVRPMYRAPADRTAGLARLCTDATQAHKVLATKSTKITKLSLCFFVAFVAESSCPSWLIVASFVAYLRRAPVAGLNWLFSRQTNSIRSVSGSRRWLTRTVHGFV